jgi:hypothetical protein
VLWLLAGAQPRIIWNANCDVNNDGVVDGSDLALAAWSLGSYGPNYLYSSSQNSTRWNPNADVNGDGVVDMKDIRFVAKNFGLGCSP